MHVALLGTGNHDGICSRPLRLSFALFYPSSLGNLGKSKSLRIPRSTVFPWSYIFFLSFPTVKLLKAVVWAVPDQSSFRNGHWSHTLRSLLTSELPLRTLIFLSRKLICCVTQRKEHAVCSHPDWSHDSPCPKPLANLYAINRDSNSNTTFRVDVPDHSSAQQATKTLASNAVPPLKRWLREGGVDAARQRGDREGYAKGGEGMKEYLKDWETKWERLEKDTKSQTEGGKPWGWWLCETMWRNLKKPVTTSVRRIGRDFL